jgi:hypothetical protein
MGTGGPGAIPSAQEVLFAAADRESLGVEVLEQGLGELAGGSELVAQPGQSDGAGVLTRQFDDPSADVGQDLGVVVEVLGHADRPAVGAEGGQVVGVELGVERRLEAGLPKALFELLCRRGERFRPGGRGSSGRRALGLLSWLSGGQLLEPNEDVAARSVLPWMCVEDDAAAQRVRRRDLADHQTVARGRDQPLLQPQLPETSPKPGGAGGRLTGAVMDVDSLVIHVGIAEVKLGIDEISRSHA